MIWILCKNESAKNNHNDCNILIINYEINQISKYNLPLKFTDFYL